MIDVHTHLLPGVDDGSPSVDVSLPVLERFATDGVQIVICTPHLDASRAEQAPHAQHAEILSQLRAKAPPLPELRLGWEIMLDTPGIDWRAKRLPTAAPFFPRANGSSSSARTIPPTCSRDGTPRIFLPTSHSSRWRRSSAGAACLGG